MTQLLESLLPYIISLGSAIIAALISLFTCLKSRSEVKQKKQELEIVKIEKEKSIAELEKSVIENSFIICPHCGTKIKVKDMDFRTNTEVM